MHPLSRQLALTMSSSDGLPRIINAGDTSYLVTPAGEVWRVLDANQPDGERRAALSSDPSVLVRVFVGAGPNPEIRCYRFGTDEPRASGAEAVYQQFRTSAAAHEVSDRDAASLPGWYDSSAAQG